MTRSWKTWSGGLLAVGLVIGCKSTHPQGDSCTTCSTCTATAQPALPPAAPPAPRLTLVPTPPPEVPMAPQNLVPLRPAPVIPRTLPTVTADPVAPSVNPEQSAPPASPWANQKPEAAPPAPPTPIAAPAPAAVPTPMPAATEPSSPAAQYYNSPDYSILFGVLDYNARHGTWRLRYADASEEDRYGGVVTLDGVGRQMEGYTSGAFVRVEGGLVDPESHDVSPAYRVKDMRPGEKK